VGLPWRRPPRRSHARLFCAGGARPPLATVHLSRPASAASAATVAVCVCLAGGLFDGGVPTLRLFCLWHSQWTEAKARRWRRTRRRSRTRCVRPIARVSEDRGCRVGLATPFHRLAPAALGSASSLGPRPRGEVGAVAALLRVRNGVCDTNVPDRAASIERSLGRLWQCRRAVVRWTGRWKERSCRRRRLLWRTRRRRCARGARTRGLEPPPRGYGKRLAVALRLVG
jgi:hypothetical protein